MQKNGRNQLKGKQTEKKFRLFVVLIKKVNIFYRISKNLWQLNYVTEFFNPDCL